MKEAIGTSFVFNMVMIFVSVFIVLYVGSIGYSKGFKIRNRIINIIEDNNGYNSTTSAAIDENLASIGYQITTRNCPIREGATIVDIESGYNYCTYLYSTDKGDYYGVTVFIRLDIPLIGSQIQIPLYGETRVLFDKGRVTG